MKAAQSSTENKYKFLILENMDDVDRFSEIYFPLTAQKNIDALMGFKSQDFRKSFGDYIVHEMPSCAPETIAISTWLSFKETDTSVVDFCFQSDTYMIQRIESMTKWVNDGKMVRYNRRGGMCNISYFDGLDVLFEPTNEQILSFVNSGEFDIDKIVINAKTIIVENDSKATDIDINLFKLATKDVNPQVITRFKSKTAVMSDKDILKAFQHGITNGLVNICFYTSGQDMHNLRKQATLLNTLLEINPTHKFNLFIKTYHNYVLDAFKMDRVVVKQVLR